MLLNRQDGKIVETHFDLIICHRNGQKFFVCQATEASLRYKLARVKKHLAALFETGWELDLRARKTVTKIYHARNILREGVNPDPQFIE